MKTIYMAGLLIMAAVNVASGQVSGQLPDRQQPAEAKRDPKVQAVFNQMIAAYRGIATLHEKVTFKFDTSVAGMLDDVLPVDLELKLQRPNKVALTYTVKNEKGKLSKYQMVSDGTSIYTYGGDANAYTKDKSPAYMPRVPQVLKLPDFDVLFRNVDPFQNLGIPSENLVIGAPTKIGGLDVDVVTGLLRDGSQGSATFMLGFGQKDRLVRGMSFSGSGVAQGKPIRFKFDAIYDLVDPNAKFTDADFVFAPPPGAKLLAPRPNKNPN